MPRAVPAINEPARGAAHGGIHGVEARADAHLQAVLAEGAAGAGPRVDIVAAEVRERGHGHEVAAGAQHEAQERVVSQNSACPIAVPSARRTGSPTRERP